MIGMRVDGTKQLIALADGFRESSESWAICSGPAVGAGGGPRHLRPVTARWGSGSPYVRCSPTSPSSGAGSTSLPTSLPPCRSRRIQVPQAALAEIYNAEDVFAVDLVLQRMKPSIRVGLGRSVQCVLQCSDPVASDSRQGGPSLNTGTHQPVAANMRLNEAAALP
jgi:hypothetical protein